jgi:predicted phage terminase large subunit-like protein
MREELRESWRKCRGRTAATKRNDLLKIHCRHDIEFFAREFFPHLCRLEFSPMHRELFLRRAMTVDEELPGRVGRRQALAAPRGNAKSTIKSLLFPLHDIVYRRERYIVIFSATMAQAQQRLKNLRREIEKNECLRAVYAEELRKTGSWTARAMSIGGIQIDVSSAGSEVRGVSSGEWRPTKIILDDVEDSDQVENADLRQHLYDWFREVIENLGDRYTHIDVVGTILHPDSLLSQLLERPDFEGRKWRSVVRFANRADLWDEWRRRYTDLGNSRRQSSARIYFNKRRDEMLEGAQALWPEKEDYYELMIQLATRGRRAFFKEKQNEPLRADSAVFDPSTFRYFHREGDKLILETPLTPSTKSTPPAPSLSQLRLVGFLDSAMGKGARRKRGDFAAIATVGADESGRLYVLDIWLERATPSEQARRIFAQHELWNYSNFGIEAIGFQGLIVEPIESVRKTRLAGGEKADLAIQEITPSGSKVERVAALEPLIHNGWLLFDRALGDEFFAQLEQFPRGRHDDGPDALAAAVELARQATGKPTLLRRQRSGSKAKRF